MGWLSRIFEKMCDHFAFAILETATVLLLLSKNDLSFLRARLILYAANACYFQSFSAS